MGDENQVENLWTTERTPATEAEWKLVFKELSSQYFPVQDLGFDWAYDKRMNYLQAAAEVRVKQLEIGARRTLQEMERTSSIRRRLTTELLQLTELYRRLQSRHLDPEEVTD